MQHSQHTIDLWRVIERDRYSYVGSFRDLTKAKQRSRIDYRSGARHEWLATSHSSNAPIEQWRCVGNPNKAHSTDCVRVWPCLDPEPPTAPAACECLTVRVNRVRWTFDRIGRREAA